MILTVLSKAPSSNDVEYVKANFKGKYKKAEFDTAGNLILVDTDDPTMITWAQGKGLA